MKVVTTQRFKIIYSLYEHQYLGYLFEAYVVQLNHKNELTYQHQSLSSQNVEDFAIGLNSLDFELVKLTEAIQQDAIFKKFNTKKLTAVDFFLKIFDSEKGDKLAQEAILTYIEKKRAEILALLKTKILFVMGNDGNPIWQRLEVVQEKARVYFHFVRNEDNTHYFPNIKCAGEKVDFQYKNAKIICDEPACLLLKNKLYHFEKNVDGKKIRPFLQKNFIAIPRNLEETYYRKFIAPLIASFDVFAKGFDIKTTAFNPQPVLIITELLSPKTGLSLFQSNDSKNEPEESKIAFDLFFQYGDDSFRFDSFAQGANVSVEKQEESWIFYKIKRDLKIEKDTILVLKERDLDLRHGRTTSLKSDAFTWIQANTTFLIENGFILKQEIGQSEKKYFLGYSSIDISVEEGYDWFDIQAKVRFGEFEIPFLKLRNLVLSLKKEFTLPNGEIAVIPKEWFIKYSELFAFSQQSIDNDGFILKKHHISLIQNLDSDGYISAVISRKLENLRNFEEIENYPLPIGFLGILRPYQKAGYDWMRFLADYRLGGCLADDMGLGKTIQTLALLQAQKELGITEPSLLIMPTSLVYNWQKEAEKFTPNLKIFVYSGSSRDKNIDFFANYDLILTSYGIARIDIEELNIFRFNYVILDESQAIKNPISNTAKAVMRLNSAHRLVLTGTPLENSTMDLWSQMTFINPGLLGSQSFFKSEFQTPIEKKADEEKRNRLYALVKPFMLRRHKSQVAKELPEKVESIHYCDMSEEQANQYEEAKSYFRNAILEHIEIAGMAKSQLILLQGLTKLRQLANHPKMTQNDYEHGSGKFDEVLEKLEAVLEGGQKVLIFSQFVKHLAIFKQYLDEKNIDYAYLDGSTSDRQKQVNSFQEDEKIQIFLISMKAGGTGLNLTAAEYVFLLDPWWNPAIEAQAIDRAHRIGQQKTVFTYKFITKDTVEEKILALQKNKQKLFSELITTEENFVKTLTQNDILNLLI